MSHVATRLIQPNEAGALRAVVDLGSTCISIVKMVCVDSTLTVPVPVNRQDHSCVRKERKHSKSTFQNIGDLNPSGFQGLSVFVGVYRYGLGKD